MAFTIRRADGYRLTLVTIAGAADATSAGPLREVLEDAVLTGVPILVDLARVTSIDHAAVAILIATQRQATLAGTSLLLRITPARLPMLLTAARRAPDRRAITVNPSRVPSFREDVPLLSGVQRDPPYAPFASWRSGSVGVKPGRLVGFGGSATDQHDPDGSIEETDDGNQSDNSQ